MSNRERLENLGKKILSSSRNELYLSMRFLDIALSGLGYKMNLNTVTVGTDGVDILFNPTYLKRVYQEDLVSLNRIYLHIILHCMLRHEINREGRDEDLWTISCDIAVESILDSIENNSIQMMISTYREEMYSIFKEQCNVLTAEAIYRVLTQMNLPYLEILRLKQEFLIDDHQFWIDDNQNNQDNPDNQSKNKKQELEMRWKHIDEQTQTNMETFFASYGKEFGNLTEVLAIENHERYDYKSFLRQFVTMREEVKIDLDTFDTAFYSYGIELYGNIPLIEPLEYRESKKIKDFVIVIDTSDSCAEGVIQNFLAETRAVLNNENLFFDDVELHIIQCDAKVQNDTVIKSITDFDKFIDAFQVIGYGGTDFRPAFNYVESLQTNGQLKDLKGLIYFTDGFGEYPKNKPPYETAFVFFRDNYIDVKVPPWVIKIVLGNDELGIK